MATNARQEYFDNYWTRQDKVRVSRRSYWRAQRLYQAVGNNYKTLLDVGAGQGELLNYFKWKRYRVTGWDISLAAVEKLREEDIEAKLVDLENSSLSGEYDLVCCCEVLQQIEAPSTVMSKLIPLVSKNGRLLLSVPNEFHFLRRLGIGKPVESHKSLFTPTRACRMAREAGMEIEKMIHQPLVPPGWGWFANLFGMIAASISPALFSLSTMMILRRASDD